MPNMNSPLGQYAPIIASIVAILCVGAYVIALLFGHTLDVSEASTGALQLIAFIAIGAVFGSAVATNGWKQPLASAHDRIDALEAVVGTTTHPEAKG